jgi:hypothetical protein
LFVAASLLSLLAGSCQGADESAEGCFPPEPGIASPGMDNAMVTMPKEGNDPLRLGLVTRDSSITIVGFCSVSQAFPEPPVFISENRQRKVKSFGGSISGAGQTWFSYVYFPTTSGRHLSILQGDRFLGTARFRESPKSKCVLSTSEPFEMRACGSIAVIQWSTDVKAQASRVAALDVTVLDARNRRENLGFFLHEVGNGPNGLSLTFGFAAPDSKQVFVDAKRLYLKRGGNRPPKEILIRSKGTKGTIAILENTDS